MRLQGLLAAAALVAACRGERDSTGEAPSTRSARFVPTGAPASSAPTSAARPDLRAPRLTPLSRRPSSLVDVAPGRAPDVDHPAGTVYLAAVLDRVGRGEATLFEWDVASARALEPEGALLYEESNKQDNGKSAEVRIATTRDSVFAAVTLEKGRFTVLGSSPLSDVHGHLHADYLPSTRNVSLETDGRWLAVAYTLVDPPGANGDIPIRGVLLYDAVTMKRVSSVFFEQSREVQIRHDILEMMDGRLYAAEAEHDKLRVVELAVPSLKVLRKAEVSLAPDPKNGRRVQLTSVRGHLVVLSRGVLAELTPDLEVVGKREIHTDEVAIGPAGELLTPVGLEAPGRRGDFVPDARASASCTPSWVGAYPLLACSVDMEGARIARLAPR